MTHDSNLQVTSAKGLEIALVPSESFTFDQKEVSRLGIGAVSFRLRFPRFFVFGQFFVEQIGFMFAANVQEETKRWTFATSSLNICRCCRCCRKDSEEMATGPQQSTF